VSVSVLFVSFKLFSHRCAAEGRDGTLYHRTCRSFFPHHARRIVRGVVLEDARGIIDGIRRLRMREAAHRTPLRHACGYLTN